MALTQGTDLATVSELLRHTSLNTTRRYLHLVNERRREAVRRLGSTVPTKVLAPVPQRIKMATPANVVSNDLKKDLVVQDNLEVA